MTERGHAVAIQRAVTRLAFGAVIALWLGSTFVGVVTDGNILARLLLWFVGVGLIGGVVLAVSSWLRRFASGVLRGMPEGSRVCAVGAAEGDLAAFAGRFAAIGPAPEGIRLDTGTGQTMTLPWLDVRITLDSAAAGGPVGLATPTGRVAAIPGGRVLPRSRWVDVCAFADGLVDRQMVVGAPR